jgi:hypothetical protein
VRKCFSLWSPHGDHWATTPIDSSNMQGYVAWAEARLSESTFSFLPMCKADYRTWGGKLYGHRAVTDSWRSALGRNELSAGCCASK